MLHEKINRRNVDVCRLLVWCRLLSSRIPYPKPDAAANHYDCHGSKLLQNFNNSQTIKSQEKSMCKIIRIQDTYVFKTHTYSRHANHSPNSDLAKGPHRRPMALWNVPSSSERFCGGVRPMLAVKSHTRFSRDAACNLIASPVASSGALQHLRLQFEAPAGCWLRRFLPGCFRSAGPTL